MNLKELFEGRNAYEQMKTDVLRELKYTQYNCGARTLYRFTSFPKMRKRDGVMPENSVIQDIRERRISLANPMLFNDPMDPIVKVWIERYGSSPNSLTYNQDAHKLMENFRICSMVHEADDECQECYKGKLPIPYLNTLMWGYYTGNHTGICIKYKITYDALRNHTDDKRILLLGDVRYREHKEMSKDITIDNALLAKSDSWQRENEARLIYFTERSKDLKYSNGKPKKYCSLEGFEIEAIYMGCKISDYYKQAVRDAIVGSHIQLYQMDFDMRDITKLKVIRVN